SAAADPAVRLLNRIAFGPSPQDLARVRQMGLDSYIEEQLGLEQLENGLRGAAHETPAATWRLGMLDTLQLQPEDTVDYPKEQVQEELQQAAVLRAVYSRWQLRELMVDFWNDHLNVSQTKGDSPFFKTPYDAEVIRANALGRFR